MLRRGVAPLSDSVAATPVSSRISRRMHERLADESDLIKRAAVAAFNAKNPGPVHGVQPGDYVWITPGSEERASYIRRHGHGDPWRFPFKVEEVKPHAVRLAIPKDGSVPDITPWQSLRKCSKSRPVLHGDDLPLPEVDAHGRVVVRHRGSAMGESPAAAPATAQDSHDDERFEIERIVRAEKRGNGWTLYVKWEGFPEVTSEPLSRIVRDTQHPAVLKQIEECQAAYLLEHPPREPEPEAPRPLPTRVQPDRAGVRRAADVAAVAPVCSSCEQRASALRLLVMDTVWDPLDD